MMQLWESAYPFDVHESGSCVNGNCRYPGLLLGQNTEQMSINEGRHTKYKTPLSEYTQTVARKMINDKIKPYFEGL